MAYDDLFGLLATLGWSSVLIAWSRSKDSGPSGPSGPSGQRGGMDDIDPDSALTALLSMEGTMAYTRQQVETFKNRAQVAADDWPAQRTLLVIGENAAHLSAGLAEVPKDAARALFKGSMDASAGAAAVLAETSVLWVDYIDLFEQVAGAQCPPQAGATPFGLSREPSVVAAAIACAHLVDQERGAVLHNVARVYAARVMRALVAPANSHAWGVALSSIGEAAPEVRLVYDQAYTDLNEDLRDDMSPRVVVGLSEVSDAIPPHRIVGALIDALPDGLVNDQTWIDKVNALSWKGRVLVEFALKHLPDDTLVDDLAAAKLHAYEPRTVAAGQGAGQGDGQGAGQGDGQRRQVFFRKRQGLTAATMALATQRKLAFLAQSVHASVLMIEQSALTAELSAGIKQVAMHAGGGGRQVYATVVVDERGSHAYGRCRDLGLSGCQTLDVELAIQEMHNTKPRAMAKIVSDFLVRVGPGLQRMTVRVHESMLSAPTNPLLVYRRRPSDRTAFIATTCLSRRTRNFRVDTSDPTLQTGSAIIYMSNLLGAGQNPGPNNSPWNDQVCDEINWKARTLGTLYQGAENDDEDDDDDDDDDLADDGDVGADVSEGHDSDYAPSKSGAH